MALADSMAWLERLVRFDTTSRNSNLTLIDDVNQYLQKYNFHTQLSFDVTEQKANLFATLPAASGETHRGGLILSGHTDVVPVDDQDWQSNPFMLIANGSRLIGRGTSDMKGFIAVVLALAPTFAKMALPQPLHIALSYDEEVGCHGARVLIDTLLSHAFQPAACIVGEPSNMRPVIAHKGVQLYQCRVHGLATHSSLTPQGCNAIEYAAKIINSIRALADEIKIKGPFDPYFDVPFTSISTNIMHAGTAYNIIPALAEFVFECRNLPQDSPDQIVATIQNQIETQILPLIQAEYPSANIEINKIAQAPAFEMAASTPLVQKAQQIAGETEILKVAYATEAGLFKNAGIPTFICGPGSIEQAHRANEFIEIQQLELCEQFLLKFITTEWRA